MRYTFKKDGKYVWNYDDLPPKDFEINAKNKFGMLEDLEEQLGCPLEVIVKAFKKYVGWTTDCDFGYDNIPDEYEKYKDDDKFKVLSYDSGLMYIAIQETLREEKSE